MNLDIVKGIINIRLNYMFYRMSLNCIHDTYIINIRYFTCIEYSQHSIHWILLKEYILSIPSILGKEYTILDDIFDS